MDERMDETLPERAHAVLTAVAGGSGRDDRPAQSGATLWLTAAQRAAARRRNRRWTAAITLSAAVVVVVVAGFVVLRQPSDGHVSVRAAGSPRSESPATRPALTPSAAPLPKSDIVAATGASLIGNAWSPSSLGVIDTFMSPAAVSTLSIPKMDGATLLDPTLDAERTRLAFVKADATATTGEGDIYSVNTDGSNLVQLTSTSSDAQPTFSPDGTEIAFVRGGAVLLMDSDGNNVRSFHGTSSANSLTWSPDGTRLAFDAVANNGMFQISILEIGSGRITPFTASDREELHPAWSPDGSRIAFSNNASRGLAVRDVSGGATVGLTTCDSPCTGDLDPIWSPDGSSLAFLRNSQRHRALFAVNADGTNAHLLVQPDADMCCATWGAP